MTKRERATAALARQPVDRPPVAFWRHVPEVDHTARGLAEAMLAFHRRFDLDLIKVMSSGVYCVEDWGCKVAYLGAPGGAKQCTEHAVKTLPDWERIQVLDTGSAALARELQAVELIAAGRPDDAPILHTVFSPLSIARKLAGDRLIEDLRAHPDAVLPALEAITRTMAHYAATALRAGADGIFFATQMATRALLTREEHERFDVPYARRVLEAVASHSTFTMLHVHGTDIYFDDLVTMPAHAINWHDRRTAPTLADAKPKFTGALVGGLAEWETLRSGPIAAISREVEDAIRQTDGTGLIVGPGCVLPLDVPEAHLDAVVSAVRAHR